MYFILQEIFQKRPISYQILPAVGKFTKSILFGVNFGQNYYV